ncbi:MAG: major capsid protein, partial [Pseudonocardia sp.]|nr:major capsid protein [Pseudonocardia sp.]
APAAQNQQEQPVAAAASNPPIGAIGRETPAPRETQRPTVAITAAADVAGFSSGSSLKPDDVGQAFANRMRSLSAIASRHGNGEQVPVVTLRASGVPDERVLLRNEFAANTRKIEQVTSRTAITAAGGLCAPLAIDYSYGTIGVQDRPIRDSLPGFQAERGGIQYRRDLSPVINTDPDTGPRKATGLWSMQDDENVYKADGQTVDPDGPRKALWVVDCPDTETAEVEALTLQLEFSNVTSRFDPETLQANTDAAMIWHARFAEQYLLEKLQGMSKVMTSAQVLGATRDLLVTLDKAQSYYRSVHRLNANVQLRTILPMWAKALIRADITRAMSFSLETLNVTDSVIDAWFGSRNVTPVWHLDGGPEQDEVTYSAGPPVVPAVPNIAAQQYVYAEPSAEGIVVPDFPAQVDFLLHPEGHFTHLDGGTLDLGIVRDSDLIERNRYRQFSETWEGVAARGVEALRIVADVLPTGGMSGTVEPAAAGTTVGA